MLKKIGIGLLVIALLLVAAYYWFLNSGIQLPMSKSGMKKEYQQIPSKAPYY